MPATALMRWTSALFLFILGTLFGLVLAVGAYLVVGRAPQPQPPPDTRPIYSRPEFTRRVLGKSESEVLSAVGKPDETSQDADVRFWHYKKRTRDPLTQDEDTDVQVVIKGGKVSDVNY